MMNTPARTEIKDKDYEVLYMFAHAYSLDRSSTSATALYNYTLSMMKSHKAVRTAINIRLAMESLTEDEKRAVREYKDAEQGKYVLNLIIEAKPPIRHITQQDMITLLPVIEKLLADQRRKAP